MKIGLVDVDGYNFPNIPLMKISAYHKLRGDNVRWYDAFDGLMEEYDIVYLSKVFSFTPDYDLPIYSKKVERGGTGYCIVNENGVEIFQREKNHNLPDEIEHIYPDYDLYPQYCSDTAYGFLTRGCPRGCSFCIVKDKEGRISQKWADLNEFWRGQRNVVLCDPNILACNEWYDLLGQLIRSEANVDFNQGLDIRMMNEKKAEMLSEIRVKNIHFAWDRYEDKDLIIPKFQEFRRKSKIRDKDLQVYVLVGDREKRVLKEDLERIYWLRDNGFCPYVMIYDKYDLPRGHELRKLQRYVNNRMIFYSIKSFEEYGGNYG